MSEQGTLVAAKPRCVLLDATPIIALHATDAWGPFIAAYDVVVPEIVATNEALFHSRDGLTGFSHPIDLAADIENGRIITASATTEDLLRLNELLDGTFDIHDGEREALALMLCREEYEEIVFCCGDRAAVYVACIIGCGERCLSLEELLQLAGQSRTLNHPMTKAFMDTHTRQGSEYRITGVGLRSSQ
jgi:hypothetical protein